MKTTQYMVSASAVGRNGELYMSRGRCGTVLVSREFAWADVKAWQNDSRIVSIAVTRGGETVWAWTREAATVAA